LNRRETGAETVPAGLAARRRRHGRTAALWPAMAVGAAAAVGLLMTAPAAGRTAGLMARSGPAVITQATPSGGTPAVGALVTIDGSGRLGAHFCSASVVDSPAGNLVITAAHCLAGRTPGGFAFVPGYDNGRTPYGVWAVTRAVTDGRWTSSSDADDDVAFLQVGRPGTKDRVQDITGGERLGTGEPAGQLVTVIGYPDDLDTLVSCRNYAPAFTATQLVFRCGGYPDGTSGSPLLADVNPATGQGAVVGVIGGYQQGGSTDAVSYAVQFGPEIAALYRDAAAGS
jgi:V8-like Glu-specific endopeptidase